MPEPIAQLVNASSTSGPGTAALADLLDGAGTVVDHRFEVAVRGRVADADQHGF
jgi:hypothetical protein